MKTIFIDNFKIHDNSASVNFIASIPITGLEIPLTRTTNFNKSGADGVTISQQFFGERRIIINGWLLDTDDVNDYETLRKSFLSEMNISKDSNGVLVPRVLKVKTLDDVEYRINVQIMGATMDLNLLDSARWTIDLLATDQVISGETLNSQSVDPLTRGGFILPVIVPIEFDASSGSTVTVTNSGNTIAYPTVTLDGPLTNPRIENLTTNEWIALSLTLSAGEQIVIDMLNRTIIQGGVTNKISFKSDASKFWGLEVGANQIKLSTSISGEAGSATIEHRDAYLGI